MASDRRAFLASSAAVVAATASSAPAWAVGFGKDYTPKFDDLKQIYALGMSLDRLKDAVQNDQGKALSGLVAFNKDPKFYTGYANNYIAKTVKNDAESDRRVGYIRQVSRLYCFELDSRLKLCTSQTLTCFQASGLLGSCQGLLEGREGIDVGGPAGTEALKRVEKAQKLIGQFLAESGVQDERIASFVASH